MTGAAPAEDELSPLALLVAECVRRLEERGPSAVDELCREHPELAPELRRRLETLEETGLLGRGRIGDYVLLRTLGRGGMGVVHLARDTRDGRRVALKALPGRLLQSEGALVRFRREAQAVAALRHPGIVPLYEAGESEGVPWFTMEWVDGRTLADVIAALSAMELAAERLDSSHLLEAAGAERGDGRGRAWVETVCRLVLDVAEALDYAHEQGVIHRDVKPSNILLGRDGRARLFDFGLARVADATRVTLSGDFTGTPAYAAPEQLAGARGPVDGRADVYALGVTMYELLTLVLPPDGASSAEPVAPRRLNPTV
ncbi:MAG TPA: serine/threonine-protein kinase, partial [Planctomycetota bacterium]|nr:serine/threonine-protein kinase [Planctomycetota bacterium]